MLKLDPCRHYSVAFRQFVMNLSCSVEQVLIVESFHRAATLVLLLFSSFLIVEVVSKYYVYLQNKQNNKQHKV